MVIRWVILVGCLFLISCAGEGVKDVSVKSLLDDGEGDYVDVEGVVESIELKMLGFEYRMGFSYSREVIESAAEGGHIYIGMGANWQVELRDIIFVHNPVGFPEVKDFYFHIHSPARANMIPDRTIGKRVKMRLHYSIEKDGAIRFIVAMGSPAEMVVVDK